MNQSFPFFILREDRKTTGHCNLAPERTMTTPPAAASPVSPSQPPAPIAQAASSAPQRGTPARAPIRILRGLGVLVVLAVLGYFAYSWWSFRASHSITDDAFVEAHIVNIAPQSVAGHIVRFLVDENERVESGQLLAEIDPV